MTFLLFALCFRALAQSVNCGSSLSGSMTTESLSLVSPLPASADDTPLNTVQLTAPNNVVAMLQVEVETPANPAGITITYPDLVNWH